MGREYTEAQKRATLKYLKESTDDIRLRVPKGLKEEWSAAAADAGVSMTKFVTDIVNEYIKRAGR